MVGETDVRYMARALQLARRGLYTASPNPCVGCVIVAGGRIVGEGWHAKTGGAHAEIAALECAGPAAREATAYLTLEPCVHHGRTPPCSNALITAGLARAVIAVRDPNPQVAGNGIAALEAAGIQTDVGTCEAEARTLNQGFFSRMQHARPWVRIKWGMSLDGFVTSPSNENRWITSDDARRDVQYQRARCGALITGAGTVITDNPRLNLRLDDTDIDMPGEPAQPLRVVVDGSLRTMSDARIYNLPGRSLLATCSSEAAAFEAAGVEIWRFEPENGRVPLAQLLKRLADRGINEVQVEAGPGLSGALIGRGLYDEILLYVAPCLFGGGLPAAVFDHIASGGQREAVEWFDIRKLGTDMRILVRRSGGI